MSQMEIGHRVSSRNLAGSTDRIIIREVTLLVSSGIINIVYKNQNPSFCGKIDETINDLKKYPETEEPGEPFLPSPLDLICIEDCWIVFYLSARWNWQFSTKRNIRTGFSTKRNENNKYGSLRHVMREGTPVSGLLVNDGCRLLYFRAKCENKPYNDGFNLHTDLILPNGERTSLIIDPEVKNPG